MTPETPNATRRPPRIVKAVRLDAAAALEARMGEAQEEAKRILAEAEAQAAAIRQTALDEARQAAAGLIAGISAEIDADLARMREALPTAILIGVRQVLAAFDDADLVARAAAKAVESMPEPPSFALRLNPARVAAVQARLAEMSAGSRIEVTPDPARPEGSSLLTTPYGDIELAVEAQLEALAAALGAKAP